MKFKPQINKSSSAMGRLISSHNKSFTSLKKGEIVKGVIAKLTPSEILVDIGAKTTGLVLEREKSILRTILNRFKVGDKVEVLVLTPEAETGMPIVSLRRYLGNIAWGKLEELAKSKQSIDVKVTEMVKSGIVAATTFGVTGFLPQSHVAYTKSQNIAPGDTLSVSIIELNRKENKIIFSQKQVLSDSEFTQLSSKFKSDQIVMVKVNNVASFGLFVTVPVPKSDLLLEGFVHISEISWKRQSDLNDLFKPGDEIEAVIIKFDKDEKKVHLSIKRLTKDPFDELMEKYPLEKKINVVVIKIEENGLVIALNSEAEGMIKAEKIPPAVSYKPGSEIEVIVAEYDKRRRKIYAVPVLKEKPIGYR